MPAFKVPPSVLQLLTSHSGASDMYPVHDVYVDIRAKAKKERTPSFLQSAMQQLSEEVNANLERNNAGSSFDIKVRLELYEPTLQHTFASKAKL